MLKCLFTWIYQLVRFKKQIELLSNKNIIKVIKLSQKNLFYKKGLQFFVKNIRNKFNDAMFRLCKVDIK